MIEEKTSTSRVRKVLGSYTFRVEGYSSLSTKVGDSIESPEFFLCGHDWQLRIFPGGSLESHKNYVSFYLASKSNKIARASYKLIVVSQVAGGSDEIFSSSGVRTFEAKGVQVDGWGRDKFMIISSIMEAANGFLGHDDSIIFKVEITVIGELELVSSVINDSRCGASLKASMQELLVENKFGDVTIVVGESEIIANKCILCARSPVFRAMLSASCRMIESQSGIIKILDFDIAIVKEVLHYMYTDELSSQIQLELMATELLCAAVKYQVVGLITISEDYLSSRLNVENVIHLLLLADTYSACRLKDKIFQFVALNHGVIIQSKDFHLVEGDLLKEFETVVELATRRQGCRPGNESERRFSNHCIVC